MALLKKNRLFSQNFVLFPCMTKLHRNIGRIYYKVKKIMFSLNVFLALCACSFQAIHWIYKFDSVYE